MVDDFHALKELTILKSGFDFERAIDKLLLKLPVNLHRLDMTHVFFIHTRLVPDSELGHLTDVKIRILDMDELPRLLRLSPNLSSLLMFDIENPIKIESPGPVMHANLQYLTVHGHLFNNNNDVGHGLFNTITLPNLRLVEYCEMGSWPHGEFKALVKQSKCPLETLFFGISMSFTNQQYEECTSLLPSLIRIAVKVYSIHRILKCHGDMLGRCRLFEG
jgi:hypothetical protein